MILGMSVRHFVAGAQSTKQVSVKNMLLYVNYKKDVLYVNIACTSVSGVALFLFLD